MEPVLDVSPQTSAPSVSAQSVRRRRLPAALAALLTPVRMRYSVSVDTDASGWRRPNRASRERHERGGEV